MTIEVLFNWPTSVATYGVLPGLPNADQLLQIAANNEQALFFPPGAFQMMGPVQLQPGAVIMGAGMLKTRIQRCGVWAGDTFTCGKADNSQQALDCVFSDFLIEQIHPGYTTGPSTTMVDRLTGGQSHLSLYGAVHGRVERVWFQHGVFGVKMMGCVQSKIMDIHSHGSWDNKNDAISENIATVYLTQNQSIPSFRYNTEIMIGGKSYIGTGGPSPDRQISVGGSIVNGVQVGGITYTGYENIGVQYGIAVEACEGLDIQDIYVGGCANDCILFNPIGMVSEVAIDGLFLDECGRAQIHFMPNVNAVNGVNIGAAMRCNGQTRARNFMLADYNSGISGNFSVMDLNMTGGNYRNYQETAMMLLGVGTGTITAPQLRAYNCRGGNYDRADIAASAYIGQASRFVVFDGGIHGGGINDGAGNYAKWGPIFEHDYNGFSANIRVLRNPALSGTDVGGISQTYPT